MCLIFVFAGNVHACFDAWIIGEDFIKDTTDTFFNMKQSAKSRKVHPPYLFQQFYVVGLYPGIDTRGIMRILNPLVETLNDKEHHRLPKYILVVPDKDLIQSMQAYNFAAAKVMGAALHYIVKQFDLLIEHRKHDLTEKKRGAVIEGHPKIIWVRMLKRPQPVGGSTLNPFMLRGKFNSILEEQIQDGNGNHRIMSIDMQLSEYDNLGTLTAFEKSEFWKEIDRAMKKFDLYEIKLLPRKFQKSENQMTELKVQSEQQRHKLPTPLPRHHRSRE